MNHNDYITYAINIANRGRRNVSPNPMVGALIVYEGRILAEGWHSKYGQAHAERIAIQNVHQKDKQLLSDACLYVTLEPCNHTGKTAPCTDLIIQSGIKKIVYGSLDPNPLMSGQSIQLLKQNKIECLGPILEDYAKELIISFETVIQKKRPFIILKWAQSADFFMGKLGEKTKISSTYSDILVHKWRSEVDGIVTTTKTLKIDSAQLNVRYWTGRDPVKIICSTRPDDNQELSPDWLYLNSTKGNLKDAFERLFTKYNIGTVLIESGPEFLNSLIQEGLWDEARIIRNTQLKLDSGLKSPILEGELLEKYALGKDEICVVRNTGGLKR